MKAASLSPLDYAHQPKQQRWFNHDLCLLDPTTVNLLEET